MREIGLMNRHCGGCTLCCKLIPVEELHKAAGQRCKHQITGKGCRIYERRPTSCREWTCLWIKGTQGGKELPLVWTHESGRKSLVLGATADHIVGMDEFQSLDAGGPRLSGHEAQHLRRRFRREPLVRRQVPIPSRHSRRIEHRRQSPAVPVARVGIAP